MNTLFTPPLPKLTDRQAIALHVVSSQGPISALEPRLALGLPRASAKRRGLWLLHELRAKGYVRGVGRGSPVWTLTPAARSAQEEQRDLPEGF